MTHLCLEQNHVGFSAALAGLGQLKGFLDGVVVVTVGHNHVPAPGFPFGGQVAFAGYLVHGTVNLLAVPVCHGNEVVQFVEYGEHAGFPNLAFLGFAVSAEAVDKVIVLVQLFAQCQAAGGAQALAQGTGSLEDAGKSLAYGRVALQAGAHLAEAAQLTGREITGTGEDGIVHRGHVTGAQDEHVLSLAIACPGGGILVHLVEIQGGEDVRAAHGTARMSALCHAHHAQDIPAYLCGNLLEFFVCFSHVIMYVDVQR